MKTPVILLLLLATLTVSAQSVRTRELEKQRKTLMTEINNTSKLLNENKKSISNLLSNLHLVSQQIKARKQLVEVLEKEIAVLNEEIELKERQIKKLDKDLQYKKENYAIALRKMYQHKNNQDQVLFILSADNIAQSFRRMLYMKEYSHWRRKQSDEIIAFQQKIRAEKEILLAGKQEKEALANVKKDEETQLQKEENTQKTEVAGLQKDRKKLQTEIDKKQQQAQALENEMKRILAEEVAKAKKAAKAEPKTERKAETAGGYAMTKEERTLSTHFAGNKGKLPFPLKGNYRIVKRFGLQQYADLKNIRYNSNGIEIKTTPGNSARTVFDGIVIGVFRASGLQNSVIVRHGNYLTLYSYLEQVFVKQGDQVKTGQEIGKIYTDTENDNATILHFEIWKEQEKLNPESWLSK
jgi:septal ring factor EnvC (AmiA/AmiB activator)